MIKIIKDGDFCYKLVLVKCSLFVVFIEDRFEVILD